MPPTISQLDKSLGTQKANIERPTKEILAVIGKELPDLTPETRKAAIYVLENPNDIGVSSIRELAQAANVKPNTLVRMARLFGYEGYEDFRQPFRDEIRQGTTNFPDRARWLQSLSRDDELGGLYSDMAESAIANIENTFAATNANKLKAAADVIVNARATYVLGVGINHTLARNFAYLADMATDNIHAIPRDGNLVIDEMSRVTEKDVLLAMTFKPYRKEVVDAVTLATSQGATIIGISDSPASPIVINAEHHFVVETDTPQFFTSTFATSALLETLMAFVVADASPSMVSNIERSHQRRHDHGIYYQDKKSP